jgi:Resolvase, N terminal domain
MQVAYNARVSPHQQQHEGTIESQRCSLKPYIQHHGWSLLPEHEYSDEGISGARLDRPALDRLRDAARRGEFDELCPSMAPHGGIREDAHAGDRSAHPVRRHPLGQTADALLQASESAYRMGCLAAASPTRIEGRLRRAGRTHHEASSTHQMQSPQRGAQQHRASVSGFPAGAQSKRQRKERIRSPQKAGTVIGRARREANPLVDATTRCARVQCTPGDNWSRQTKTKSAQKSLTITAT